MQELQIGQYCWHNLSPPANENYKPPSIRDLRTLQERVQGNENMPILGLDLGSDFSTVVYGMLNLLRRVQYVIPYTTLEMIQKYREFYERSPPSDLYGSYNLYQEIVTYNELVLDAYNLPTHRLSLEDRKLISRMISGEPDPKVFKETAAIYTGNTCEGRPQNYIGHIDSFWRDPMVDYGIRTIRSDRTNQIIEQRYQCCDQLVGTPGCWIGTNADRFTKEPVPYDFAPEARGMEENFNIEMSPENWMVFFEDIRQGTAFKDLEYYNDIHNQIVMLKAILTDSLQQYIEENVDDIFPNELLDIFKKIYLLQDEYNEVHCRKILHNPKGMTDEDWDDFIKKDLFKVTIRPDYRPDVVTFTIPELKLFNPKTFVQDVQSYINMISESSTLDDLTRTKIIESLRSCVMEVYNLYTDAQSLYSKLQKSGINDYLVLQQPAQFILNLFPEINWSNVVSKYNNAISDVNSVAQNLDNFCKILDDDFLDLEDFVNTYNQIHMDQRIEMINNYTDTLWTSDFKNIPETLQDIYNAIQNAYPLKGQDVRLKNALSILGKDEYLVAWSKEYNTLILILNYFIRLFKNIDGFRLIAYDIDLVNNQVVKFEDSKRNFMRSYDTFKQNLANEFTTRNQPEITEEVLGLPFTIEALDQIKELQRELDQPIIVDESEEDSGEEEPVKRTELTFKPFKISNNNELLQATQAYIRYIIDDVVNTNRYPSLNEDLVQFADRLGECLIGIYEKEQLWNELYNKVSTLDTAEYPVIIILKNIFEIRSNIDWVEAVSNFNDVLQQTPTDIAANVEKACNFVTNQSFFVSKLKYFKRIDGQERLKALKTYGRKEYNIQRELTDDDPEILRELSEIQIQYSNEWINLFRNLFKDPQLFTNLRDSYFNIVNSIQYFFNVFKNRKITLQPQDVAILENANRRFRTAKNLLRRRYNDFKKSLHTQLESYSGNDVLEREYSDILENIDDLLDPDQLKFDVVNDVRRVLGYKLTLENIEVILNKSKQNALNQLVVDIQASKIPNDLKQELLRQADELNVDTEPFDQLILDIRRQLNVAETANKGKDEEIPVDDEPELEPVTVADDSLITPEEYETAVSFYSSADDNPMELYYPMESNVLENADAFKEFINSLLDRGIPKFKDYYEALGIDNDELVSQFQRNPNSDIERSEVQKSIEKCWKHFAQYISTFSSRYPAAEQARQALETMIENCDLLQFTIRNRLQKCYQMINAVTEETDLDEFIKTYNTECVDNLQVAINLDSSLRNRGIEPYGFVNGNGSLRPFRFILPGPFAKYDLITDIPDEYDQDVWDNLKSKFKKWITEKPPIGTPEIWRNLTTQIQTAKSAWQYDDVGMLLSFIPFVEELFDQLTDEQKELVKFKEILQHLGLSNDLDTVTAEELFNQPKARECWDLFFDYIEVFKDWYVESDIIRERERLLSDECNLLQDTVKGRIERCSEMINAWRNAEYLTVQDLVENYNTRCVTELQPVIVKNREFLQRGKDLGFVHSSDNLAKLWLADMDYVTDEIVEVRASFEFTEYWDAFERTYNAWLNDDIPSEGRRQLFVKLEEMLIKLTPKQQQVLELIDNIKNKVPPRLITDRFRNIDTTELYNWTNEYCDSLIGDLEEYLRLSTISGKLLDLKKRTKATRNDELYTYYNSRGVFDDVTNYPSELTKELESNLQLINNGFVNVTVRDILKQLALTDEELETQELRNHVRSHIVSNAAFEYAWDNQEQFKAVNEYLEEGLLFEELDSVVANNTFEYVTLMYNYLVLSLTDVDGTYRELLRNEILEIYVRYGLPTYIVNALTSIRNASFSANNDGVKTNVAVLLELLRRLRTLGLFEENFKIADEILTTAGASILLEKTPTTDNGIAIVYLLFKTITEQIDFSEGLLSLLQTWALQEVVEEEEADEEDPNMTLKDCIETVSNIYESLPDGIRDTYFFKNYLSQIDECVDFVHTLVASNIELQNFSNRLALEIPGFLERQKESGNLTLVQWPRRETIDPQLRDVPQPSGGFDKTLINGGDKIRTFLGYLLAYIVYIGNPNKRQLAGELLRTIYVTQSYNAIDDWLTSDNEELIAFSMLRYDIMTAPKSLVTIEYQDAQNYTLQDIQERLQTINEFPQYHHNTKTYNNELIMNALVDPLLRVITKTLVMPDVRKKLTQLTTKIPYEGVTYNDKTAIYNDHAKAAEILQYVNVGMQVPANLLE